MTALPIGRCKSDEVAQFPIGLVTLIGTDMWPPGVALFDSGTLDVVVWLRSLGLGKYEAAFRENGQSDPWISAGQT